MNKVATVRSDSNGNFEFKDVPEGHYTLVIDVTDKPDDWVDAYDVEITRTAPKTKNVLIDVSPFHPDCKGGHEFIVETAILLWPATDN